MNTGLIDTSDMEHKALPTRLIKMPVVKKFNYQVGKFRNKPCQVANYMKGNEVVAQKIRFANKDFLFLGDTKDVSLYGQWLWGQGGKQITVCEGEIDTLTVSQLFNNKYAVVGVPHGAAGAKKAVARNLDYLGSFERVIFCFDMDGPGQKAAKECAQLLPPRKACIAHLSMHDPNDMIKAGRFEELTSEIWEATPFQPDGILNGKDLWDLVSKEDKQESKDYPFAGLNEMTRGIRVGEIVTVTAGSGIGKSQLVREVMHHLLSQGETIGYIALEENVKRTALGLMSLAINQPLHLGFDEVKGTHLKEAFDATLGTGRVYLYDHWGSAESDNLMSKIRYMAHSGECRYIALDHVSICVSGLEGGDERRMIDNLMTNLRSLAEELKIGLILVSHLRRPSGDKDHTDGAKTSLGQLRGSGAIGQLSDQVFGCERDQQSSDNAHSTTVRVLKNRWTGQTGVACVLEYDQKTGRMTEVATREDTLPDDQKEVQWLNV